MTRVSSSRRVVAVLAMSALGVTAAGSASGVPTSVATRSLVASSTTTAPARVSGPADTCNVTTPTANSTVTGLKPLQSTEYWGGTVGSEYFIGTQSVGFSEIGVDWQRQFVAAGNKTPGLQTTGYPNGTYAVSCRDFGTWGVGPKSTPVNVTISNPARIVINSPAEGAQLDATTTPAGQTPPLVTLKATTTVTGTTAPTSAQFQVDGITVATGPCVSNVCTATWSPANHTSRWLDAKAKGGLRVITASATAGNGSVAKSMPTRVFLNKSDATSKLLLSTFETTGRGRVGRDGGWSARIPGTNRALFAFGDGEYVWNTGPKQGTSQWVPHSTMASTPIVSGLPGAMTESPNLNQHPGNEPLMTAIHNPPGMTDPQGGTCDYNLTWPTGMVKNPANNNLLVSYMGMCTEPPTGQTGPYSKHQVEGIADYNPTTGATTLRNIFVAPSKGELPVRTRFMSPVIDGSYLYFYNSDSTGAYAARVPATQWATPSAYRWWTASGFTATSSATTTPIGAGSTNGLAISVNRYPTMTGSPFLKVTQPTWQTITVEKSTTPYGPWSPTKITNKAVCPECQDNRSADGGFVYSSYGHPDFSNATQIMVTYTDHAQYRVLTKMFTVL